MDDKDSPDSTAEEPQTTLPNIESFTDVPKDASRRNLFIGIGLAVVLALAVSSYLIVSTSAHWAFHP